MGLSIGVWFGDCNDACNGFWGLVYEFGSRDRRNSEREYSFITTTYFPTSVLKTTQDVPDLCKLG